MSEQHKNGKNTEETPPTASPEQQRAFRIVLADLLKLAKTGEPTMISGTGGETTESLAKAFGQEFVDNGVSNGVHLPKANGVTRVGGATFNGGDGLRASGSLGSLWLQPDIFEHCNQDIWTFYPDSNISLEKWIQLAEDEEVEQADGSIEHDRTEFDHWLDTGEIEELGELVSSLEPDWPELKDI